MKHILNNFLSIGLFLFVFSCKPSTNQYEKIVIEIKKLAIPVETLVEYKIDDFSNLSTLKKLPDNYQSISGKGRGHIWIYKTANNLSIFIETLDHGHAGSFGVAYSENGEVPNWDSDNWVERWNINKKINEHWWEMSYRLG